jgi:hypothetical protein
MSGIDYIACQHWDSDYLKIISNIFVKKDVPNKATGNACSVLKPLVFRKLSLSNWIFRFFANFGFYFRRTSSFMDFGLSML